MGSRIENRLINAAIAANTINLSPTSTETAHDSTLTATSENHSSAVDRLYWSSLSSGFESPFDSHWDYAESRALQNGQRGMQYNRRRLSSNDSELYEYLKSNDRSIPLSTSESVGDVADMARQWEGHLAEKNKTRIHMADQHHRYDFPRWRSNDALTASLVASRENITIPADSNLPVRRLKMMEQTERNAKIDKERLHRKAATVQGRLSKSNSISASNLQLDYQPWYDRKLIRENIIRESIANTKETRKRFESGLVWKESEKRHERIRGGEIAKPIVLQEYRDKAPNISQFEVQIQRSAKEERVNSPETGSVKEQVEQDELSVEETDSADGYRRPNGVLLYGMSSREREVLSFFKENMDIIQDLGIVIPQPLKTLMDDEKSEKTDSNAKLSTKYNGSAILEQNREKSNGYEEMHHWDNDYTKSGSVTPRRMYRVDSIRSSSATSWLDTNSEPFPYSPGHRTWQYRFHQTMRTPPPENKRPLVQEVDRTMPGRSLIAAEIRLQNEREDELKRSRSELGLPDLQETLQIWKYGYGNDEVESFHGENS